MSERHVEPGEVVEYADKGRLRLALVTRVDAGGKLRALTEQGRETTLATKTVTARAGTRIAPGQPVEAVARALGALRARAEARMQGVGLEALWELVLEAPELLELDQASDLLFAGQVDGETRLATLWLLREDRVHFKSRNGEDFEARSAEQVEALLSEAAAEAQRVKGRERFIETLVAVMQAPPETRRERIETAARESEMFQRYLDLVISHAVEGDDAPAARDAEALIDDVQAQLGRQLKGSRARRAFWALVEAGLWSRDENLLLRRHGVPTSFSDAIRAEAERVAAGLDEALRDPARVGQRRDLRDWLTVTIDDAETRDIDDALSVAPTGDGGFRVAVHIASPGFFVPFDSPLEQSARRRGTSIYLPTGVIPMFPEILSEQGFSLLEGADRPALSFIAEVTTMGEVVHEEIVASLVRVDHRLEPDEVDRILERGEGALATALIDLYTAADGLHTTRQMTGAFSIGIPERKVRVADGDGAESGGDDDDDSESGVEPVVEIKLLNDDSMGRLLVGELMVLANTMAARYCAEHGVPVTYRTQVAPDPPVRASDFEDVPAGLARAFAMRQRMRPARPDTEPRPHFALGVAAYAQTTSPIRRYGDLMVHYQIEHHLMHGTALLDLETMREAQSVAEDAAGVALKVQRETERYWTLRYLGQRKGQVHLATIVGYGSGERADRASAVLHDCVVPVSVSTRKRLPIGSEIKVRIEGVNARQGQLHVRLEE